MLDDFNITHRNKRKLKFVNQNGQNIPTQQFQHVIAQYKSCAFFCLEMIITDNEESSDEENSHIEALKNFIVDKDKHNDLLEEQETFGDLSNSSLSKVSSHIFNYILSKYTIKAKKEDITKVCEAAVAIFDSLKLNNGTSNDIVSFL